MTDATPYRCLRGPLTAAALLLAFMATDAHAQDFPLGQGPWVFDTYSPGTQIRVSVVARGIAHPWGMVFLPDGDLRRIRDGVLEPNPIPGTPEVAEAATDPEMNYWATTAVGAGRYDGEGPEGCAGHLRGGEGMERGPRRNAGGTGSWTGSSKSTRAVRGSR